MAPETFKTLLSGYHAGTLSAAERQQLTAVLHDPAHRELLESVFLPDELMTTDFETVEDFDTVKGFEVVESFKAVESKEALAMVYERIKLDAIYHEAPQTLVESKKPLYIRRWAAAASVVLTLAAGSYYLTGIKERSIQDDSTEVLKRAEYILPGGNKAMLTLSDGSTIVLDGKGNGEIARQSGVTIKKTADGQLLYAVAAKNPLSVTKVDYNTVVTPRGGQYQIALPDGTLVWLNAASSLRYPTVFTGEERRVELKGEAYFEVAKDKQHPFYVKTQKQEVQVLGTHFNINAYEDERAVKTTLIEGLVKIKLNTGKMAMLRPGEQSAVIEDIRVNAVDGTSAIDWKEGLFWFNDESISSIMRQFSRWYDIEVEYRGAVDNLCFGGQISRMKNLSQVLRVLSLTKAVQFKMEGRKIIVMPNPAATVYKDKSVKTD